MHLLYDMPSRTPTHCACDSSFSVDHALSCSKGGFPSIRHNEVRDLTAELLTEVCHDVEVEPHLQSLNDEKFHYKTRWCPFRYFNEWFLGRSF